jgi:hypothetical protein
MQNGTGSQVCHHHLFCLSKRKPVSADFLSVVISQFCLKTDEKQFSPYSFKFNSKQNKRKQDKIILLLFSQLTQIINSLFH